MQHPQSVSVPLLMSSSDANAKGQDVPFLGTESALIPPLPGSERLAARSEGGLRVLLVDGDPGARSLLKDCIEPHGHWVTVATDEGSAWQAFEELPDLRVVILDWHLPGGSALRLLHRLRQADRPTYTHILVTTRSVGSHVLRHAMASGADDVLVKPFFHELLEQRISVASRMLDLEDALHQRARELAARSREIAALRAQDQHELRAAAEVQRALLPQGLDQYPGLRLAYRWLPSAELGGDLPGVVRLDADHVAFYILDVSGHGVASALLAVQVNRLLEPRAGASLVVDAHGCPVAPDAVCRALNARFPMNRKDRLYFTMVYGVYQVPTRRLEWARAGHPWPVLGRGGQASTLEEAQGPPIGWVAAPELTTSLVQLQPGDRLLFLSDGAPEALDPRDQAFGFEGVTEQWAATLNRPLETAMDAMMQRIKSWNAGSPLDDLTLLALEVPAG
jgi:sigma-B regulation protein RsbU (phosphoserine phosphatase)